MTKQRDHTFPMGTSMTEVAERAIEHEIALLGADMERRLTEALEVVRAYNREDQADVGEWIDAVAAGEESGLDPMRDVANTAGVAACSTGETSLDDPLGVLAAFSRR